MSLRWAPIALLVLCLTSFQVAPGEALHHVKGRSGSRSGRSATSLKERVFRAQQSLRLTIGEELMGPGDGTDGQGQLEPKPAPPQPSRSVVQSHFLAPSAPSAPTHHSPEHSDQLQHQQQQQQEQEQEQQPSPMAFSGAGLGLVETSISTHPHTYVEGKGKGEGQTTATATDTNTTLTDNGTDTTTDPTTAPASDSDSAEADTNATDTDTAAVATVTTAAPNTTTTTTSTTTTTEATTTTTEAPLSAAELAEIHAETRKLQAEMVTKEVERVQSLIDALDNMYNSDLEWFNKDSEKIDEAYTKTQDAHAIVENAMDADVAINVFSNVAGEKKETRAMFSSLLEDLGVQKEELRKQEVVTEDAYTSDRELLKTKLDLLEEQLADLTVTPEPVSDEVHALQVSEALAEKNEQQRKDTAIQQLILEASKEYVNSNAHATVNKKEYFSAKELAEFKPSNDYCKSESPGTVSAYREETNTAAAPGWGEGLQTADQLDEHGVLLAGVQFTPDTTTDLAVFAVSLSPSEGETTEDPTARNSESLVFGEDSVMVVWKDAPDGVVEHMEFDFNQPGHANTFSITVNLSGRLEYRKNDEKFFVGHWPVSYPLKLNFASSTENVRVTDVRWLERETYAEPTTSASATTTAPAATTEAPAATTTTTTLLAASS